MLSDILHVKTSALSKDAFSAPYANILTMDFIRNETSHFCTYTYAMT